MTTNGTRYFPESITEELDARGWSLSDLAERTGQTVDEVRAMLAPSGMVDDDAAARLSAAFGTSATFWRNLWEADERSRREAYATLIAEGLSDAESRGTVWPDAAD